MDVSFSNEVKKYNNGRPHSNSMEVVDRRPTPTEADTTSPRQTTDVDEIDVFDASQVEENGLGIQVLIVPLCALYISDMYQIFTSGSTVAWVIFTQFFWTTVVVLGILCAIRVYCFRNMLLELIMKFLYEEYGGSIPGLPDTDTRCMGIQTDNVDYQSESDRLIKQYSNELKQAQRYILQMKRKFTQRVCALKDMSKQRSQFLSKMQLKFPNIEREKDLLIAEREAIEKQYQEERRRNRELISRFQRLHQQFGRIGQAAFTQHPRDPNVVL